jgi:hypothetical protein
MANGGVIGEPVLGVGASGATYSFGENGPERVSPTWHTSSSGPAGNSITYVINVAVSPMAHPAEVGRQVVASIQAYERGSGPSWRT